MAPCCCGDIYSLSVLFAIARATIATVTPAAVENAFNVATAAFIDVPAGCCVNLAVKNISTQEITAANSNLIIERVA